MMLETIVWPLVHMQAAVAGWICFRNAADRLLLCLATFVEVHCISDWLTNSRAANLEELRDRDALHVAGGVRDLQGHNILVSIVALSNVSLERCAKSMWLAVVALLPGSCVAEHRSSVCTHRSKGDGGVALLVGDLCIGAANIGAAIELKGGLPWAAAACRRVEGQPRARLDEARQLGWPGCSAQRCGNASGIVQSACITQVRPALL